jgi:PII-like signaling protein
VSDGWLKLTTYFGERDRTPERLLADELIDIYGAHRVTASVLLRGFEGFSRLHHLRSDRLLTLSEDLPAVSIAVDTSERIEAVLADVLAVKRRGLITLERIRLLAAAGGAVEQPDLPGEAAKLSVYVGRLERAAGMPAHVAVCDLLHRRGVAGATVLLGVDGIRRGRRARARFFGRNADVPMLVVAVGAGERIAAVLPELARLLSDPLVTLERVRVCKRDGELLATPHELPAVDEHGLARWQKLTVYTSQAAIADGRSLHHELVRRLRVADAAGATSLRGIWGYHGDHEPHGDRFFQVRRHVPVVTTTIDTPENSIRSFAIIDELTRDGGLVISEMVPAMQAMSATERRGGLRLARHDR